MSLYWKCQLVGWSALAGWSLLTLFVWGEPTPRNAGASVGYAGVGLAATHLFRSAVRPDRWVTLPVSRIVLRVLVASVLLGVALQAVLLPFVASELPSDTNRIVLAVAQAGQGAVLMLGWFLLYFGYHFHRRSTEAEEAEWRLRVAMQERELGTLRAQLNPHFLFNSLNSLRALIPEDPARAQDAVTTLARVLRHTLRLSRSRTVGLGEELAAARSYLELEELRFDERLTHAFHVPDELHDQAVPPMLLQTLVENAVKHGIAGRPKGGAVRVEAWEEGGSVVITVTNPGTLPPEKRAGEGIGLANAREQLRLLFGEGSGLELREEEGEAGEKRVVCRVILPRRCVWESAGETPSSPQWAGEDRDGTASTLQAGVER